MFKLCSRQYPQPNAYVMNCVNKIYSLYIRKQTRCRSARIIWNFHVHRFLESIFEFGADYQTKVRQRYSGGRIGFLVRLFSAINLERNKT